jgi:hypothetical protein
MSTAPQALAHCPDCGAEAPADSLKCWLCHRQLAVQAELVDEDSPRSHRAPPRRTSGVQFSLETLMLVITLFAVCLGVIMAAPGLGILVAIVAAPALVRTLVAGYQERKAGTPLTLGEKLLTFLASTGVSLAVVITGWTAFAAACLGSCFVVVGLESTGGNWWRTYDDTIFFVLFGVSAIVGLGTAGWLFWVLRPRK